MADTVGFIGLGVMGRPMARHLLRGGRELVVLNRSRAAVDELAAEGAQPAASPRELAERSDVVITMLPDSPQVREVVAGAGGVLCGASPGDLVIDMSTIAPGVSRELARAANERGVRALDAPVSGGEVGALEARLSIMVGGSEPDFERARPLFELIGTPLLVGAAGAGQVVKVCNQIVVALNIEALGEALVLCSKAGVDPALALRALSGGLAGSRVLEAKGPNMLEHDFEPGFRVDLHRKDLGIALAAGREQGVSLPVTALVDQLLAAVQARGHGGDDHSALVTALEQAAQHRVGGGALGPSRAGARSHGAR